MANKQPQDPKALLNPALFEQVSKDAEGVETPIRRRNGDWYLAPDGKTRATLTIIGSESERYRAHREAEYKAAAKAAEQPAAELTTRRIAAGAVIAWHGWGPTMEDPPCTVENVAALLEIEHILGQVQERIAKGSDFFVTASAS